MTRRTSVTFVVGLALLVATSPAGADDLADGPSIEQRVGVAFGAARHILGKPDDGGGDSLMSGTAFTGTGFVLGGTWELELSPFAIETGLFFQQSNGTGFETTGDARREARITATSLRVPVRGKARYDVAPRVWLVGGVGLDVLLGLGSSSVVTEQNIAEADALELRTTSVTTVLTSLIGGVELDLDKLRVPILLQASWNPFVAGSTPERFDGYESSDSRGAFQVEFDWQLEVTLGVSYGFSS